MDALRRNDVVAGAFAVAVGIGLIGCRPEAPPVTQPISFNHQLHLSKNKDMDCSTCHEHVETADFATLPNNDVCMGCHGDPLGKDPEEPKVRELAAKGPIPWIQVNRFPGHVYFSHQAHVTWGKVECKECHGDMTKVSQPVTVSNIKQLTMSACRQCHAERHARGDCLTCHK